MSRSEFSTTVIGNNGLMGSVKKREGPVPETGTGPFCYQLGMKKRNAREVMMK